MKDLDFDEIDRAVSSANTNVAITDKSKTETSDTATPPLVVRPRTGKIMDVVQPSSSVRIPLVLPERPSSRQGITVNPVAKTPVKIDNIVAAPTSDLPTPNTNSAKEWPDPIDMQNNDENSTTVADEAPEKKENENEDDDIDRISDEIAKTLNPTLDKSMDSPFLSDAKVEKRPLGTFSDDLPTPKVEPSVPDKKPAESFSPVMNPKAVNLDTPMPAELQDDLLLIESNTAVAPVEKLEDVIDTTPAIIEESASLPAETTETEIIDEKSPVEPSEKSEPVKPESPVTPAAPTLTDDKPIGPTSITQQYTEQPSTSDQNTGAIYDTNVYHKTLIHPVAKKSNMMWIVWVALLLIVGAGAGAIVYFFVL